MAISFRYTVLSLIFFGSVSAFLVLQYGGAVISDFALRNDKVVRHPTARVISAKCTRYYYLVSACTTEYDDLFVVPTPSKEFKPRRELSYLMFGSVAGEHVAVLQSASRPEIVTTSTGLAHVGNRMLTLIVMLGLCVLAFFGTILRAARGANVISVPLTPSVAPSTDDTPPRTGSVSPNGYRRPAVQPGGFGKRGLAR